VTCFLSTTILLGFWRVARLPYRGAATVAAIFFATSGSVAVWTFGGLEQPLLALLLVGASGLILTALDDPLSKPVNFLVPGVAFGLLCLVRPDAPLFCVPAGIAVLMTSGRRMLRLHKLAALALGPVVALVGVEVFRLMYYNAWVPNTALVKLSPSGDHFAAGWLYVIGGWASLTPVAIMAGAAIILLLLRAKGLPAVAFLTLTPLLWSVYLIFIGGGNFSGYRHFVPVVAILAVAIAHGGDRVWSFLKGPRARLIVGLGMAILLILNVSAQMQNKEFRRARETSWVWAGRDIALMLVDAYGHQQPTLAVTAAGSIPFWTRFPCIDMLGLNDRHIARHRPKDFGHGTIGHEHGDGAYILSRAPDIIQPCGPWGGLDPCYRAVKELHSDGSLERFFAPVTLIRPPAQGRSHIHTALWLRRDSPLVGVRQVDDRLFVPATLARPEGTASGIAWVAGPGQVEVPMSAGHVAIVRLPFQPRGQWSAHLEPPLPAVIEIETLFDREGSAYPAIRVVPQASGLVVTIVMVPSGQNASIEWLDSSTRS
jgi:hypothetical protein